MKKYPLILIPSVLKSAKFAVPPSPVFNEQPPAGPEPEPQLLDETSIGIELGLLAFICFIFLILGGIHVVFIILSVFIGLFGRILIEIQILEDKKSYPKRHHQWQLEVEKYSKLEKVYLQRKTEHKQKVAEATGPAKVTEFRLNAIQEVLREIHVYSHNGINTSVNQGPCEKIIKNKLSQYFPGEIHTCLAFKIPNYEYPYTTDCAYVNSRSNISIDIEVDEPYIYSSKEPYHYINSWTDEKRNEFFLERNWIVIRFAEEQVARWPLSCCKVVATTINELTGQPIPETLASQPDLPRIKRWTEAEAKEMAYNNFRNTYL
ncbi:hypothetical protein NG799_21800 [Laspinema sp. D1]|uniref:Uncharacterized protein n=1 Tax=Laspinema palackyanum D2a TaxID=2953684 RepID=A0ABT2MW36_9CYAN|nr:hypothetical protein [Laspinema sp. D2a]